MKDLLLLAASDGGLPCSIVCTFFAIPPYVAVLYLANTKQHAFHETFCYYCCKVSAERHRP